MNRSLALTAAAPALALAAAPVTGAAVSSGWFRVAVEGATVDGRTIERGWLTDIAATYNRDTYAARVNLEHFRGVTAEPPFQALGDVTAVKTEEIDLAVGGKTERRLALFARIDALPPLVEMNRKAQKLYTSIEVNPNFAATGKAYLVGLAVTDSPASLGTELLRFAASQGEANPLRARKQDPGNYISEASETELAFAAPVADEPGLIAKLGALLSGFARGEQDPAPATTRGANDPAPVTAPAPIAPPTDAVPAAGAGQHAAQTQPAAPSTADPAAMLSAVASLFAASVDALTREVRSANEAATARLTALETQLAGTPSATHAARPLQTGTADAMSGAF